MSDLVVGLMSGTSLDGVDAALVRIESPASLELQAFRTTPYAAADRQAITQVMDGGGIRDVALLHAELGERFALAVAELLKQVQLEPSALRCVASHGQTVWHEPGRASLQLGDPARIAERLGVTVVSDFRSRDVAAGGQGAPLVPMADAMLFGHPDRGRVLLNLGGMANLTWVPQRGSLDGVIAFDTGPGVAALDAIARHADPTQPFDVGGKRAARGTVKEEVAASLLERDYFAVRPPKSTGREQFGEAYAMGLLRRVREAGGSDDDALATALAVTVRSIAHALERWVPVPAEVDLVVSGGGARNPVLLAQLEAALGSLPIARFDDMFFDGDAKEAAAFAYLGWMTLEGRAGNVREATGAEGSRVLGSITPV